MSGIVKTLKFLTPLLVVALMLFIMFGGVVASVDIGEATVMEIGKFGKAPVLGKDSDTGLELKDYSSVISGLMAEALAPKATLQKKKEAINALYRLGCYTYFTVPYRGTRYEGGGEAGTQDPVEKRTSGSMKINGESYMVHTPGNLSSMSKDQKYYYSGYDYTAGIMAGAKLNGKENPTVAALIEGVLCENKKEAILPDGKIINSKGVVKNPQTGEVFKDKYNFFEASFKEGNEKYIAGANVSEIEKDRYPTDWGKNDKFGFDSPERSKFVINASTILDENLTLETKVDADGYKYYEVTFEIDCTLDANNENVATKFARANLMTGRDSLIKELVYDFLKIKMQVYDTGYFRYWETDELWKATLSIIGGTIYGQSSAMTKEYYNYDKREVMRGIKDNWFGEKAFSVSNGGYTIKA